MTGTRQYLTSLGILSPKSGITLNNKMNSLWAYMRDGTFKNAIILAVECKMLLGNK